MRRRKEFRRQGPANTAFQTAQQIYPTCPGGSSETGAQTESRAGFDPRRERSRRKMQPGNLTVARKMVAYPLAVDRRETRFRACRRPQHGSGRTRPLGEQDQGETMRGLPVPAGGRLSEGDQTPEAPYESFRDWQRTHTQSSVTALRSPRQLMDVRFCTEQEPTAERHTLRVGSSWRYFVLRAPQQARVGKIVFSLDK